MHRERVEEQRVPPCPLAPAGVELICRRGEGNFAADPLRQRREDDRGIEVRAVVGDDDGGALEAAQVLASFDRHRPAVSRHMTVDGPMATSSPQYTRPR